MNKIKKIVSVFLLISIMCANFFNIFAKTIEESDKINLVYDHDCISLLKIKGLDMLKGIAYVCYTDPDTGIRYPAFCVEPGNVGVGTGGGNSYDVKVSQLESPILWRILYKGYVGSSYKDWNLECDDDLYYATKTAVHCFADGSTPTGKYEEPHRVGYGEDVSFEEVLRRGKAVLEVAQKLYEYGYNGTENYVKSKVSVSAKRQTEETLNGVKYLVQSYQVKANKELSSYEVSTLGFPSGTRVLNSSNSNASKMTNSTFKIAVPISKITNNITGTINIKNAKVKSYPIFYGDSGDENTQDYVFIDYNETASAKASLKIDAYKSTIKVIKEDAETKYRIPDVVFNFRYSDGENIGNFTTDSNGEITIKKLRQGTVIATEMETNEEYVLDSTAKEIKLGYAESKLVNITNNKKRGNIQVYKLDKDNNKIAIKDVKFDLYSEEFGKIIGTYTTNENGEITIENLRIGEYKLIEKETNKWYNLSENVEVGVEVKWNETTETIIENELKKGQVRVIKVDKDNNEIKLANVEFEVLDENDNVLEKIITNKEGEALTSKYAIRDFEKIKLRETKTLEEYVLTNEVQTVELKEDEITDVKFENERIKGYVKVVKTAEEDSKITGRKAGDPIEGVKFGVYDENKELIKEIITDEKGEATTDELVKGKYFVREIETDEWFVLDDNFYEVPINKNNEVATLEIKNKPKEPEIDIEKSGPEIASVNQEIKYDFEIRNTGNVEVNDFTWYDFLPYKQAKITKISTGTYNQDINYSIYYKTNKKDEYMVLQKDLNSKVNNYVDVSKVYLEENECITEIKVVFGTVDVGFSNEESAYICMQINQDLEDNTNLINETILEGNYQRYKLRDEHIVRTVVKNTPKVKKLPRTGF